MLYVINNLSKLDGAYLLDLTNNWNKLLYIPDNIIFSGKILDNRKG